VTAELIEAAPADWARGGGDRRRRTLVTLAVIVAVLAIVVAYGTLAADAATTTHLDERNEPPSFAHPFGTDWLGRDMLARTARGLRLSLLIGAVAATVSAVIALVVATIATLGRVGDTLTSWLTDLFLALPHLVLVILLAFVMGGGLRALIVAVAVTHWPSLARVLRGESRAVMSSDYVAIARRLGRSRVDIARQHLAGHLLPQFCVGLILLFPHAILHEAALSFLGLGVDPSTPAIGIILADSMRSLSVGMWWLAVLPGVALVLVVKLVDTLGNQLRSLLDPRSHHG
jgi:peptide/nickel transport system permease protein